MSQQESGDHQMPSSSPSLVTLQIQIRPEHAQQLRSLAAREGATPEALAVLILEEQLDATRQP